VLLLNVSCRPDLGPCPKAVVSGLEFSSSSSNDGSSLDGRCDGGSTEASATPVNNVVQRRQDMEAAATAEPELSGTLQDLSVAAAAESYPAGTAPDPAAISSQGWHDYLVAVSGDYSSDEHDNMWPHMLASMADGRVLHNARNAADVASFVATAQLQGLRQHAFNLIRWAFDRRGDSTMYGPQWVMTRLQERWGLAALLQFGVDQDFLSECIKELVHLPRRQDTSEPGVLLPADDRQW